MPIPIWLCRPNHEVAREPLQSDFEYRKCCNQCKPETCFKVVLGFECFGLTGMAFSIPFFPLVGGLGFLTLCLIVVLGFAALQTKKPSYMQLVLFLQLPSTGFSTIALAVNWSLIMIAYSEMDGRRKEEKDKLLVAVLLSWGIFVILTVILCRMLRSADTYYCYLRDRQIWIEQQWNPVNVDVE